MLFSVSVPALGSGIPATGARTCLIDLKHARKLDMALIHIFCLQQCGQPLDTQAKSLLPKPKLSLLPRDAATHGSSAGARMERAVPPHVCRNAVFFAFNVIWVGLAIRLAELPYGLSAAPIGSYSFAGLLADAGIP